MISLLSFDKLLSDDVARAEKNGRCCALGGQWSCEK